MNNKKRCKDIYELFNSIVQKDQRIEELEKQIERHSNYFIKLNEELRNEYDYAEQLKEVLTSLAIEKLEEVLKWVDKESDGNMMYSASILIERLNLMIEELKRTKL